MPPVVLLEPMSRFQCNLQGCCCEGWTIVFDGQDFDRLVVAFDEQERDELIRGWRIWVNKDQTVHRFQLGRRGDNARCQFLRDDRRCELHARKGVEVLPSLCRSFPAFATAGPNGPELHFDAVCPEVLLAVVREAGPLRPVVHEAPEGSDLAFRAARTVKLPAMHIGTQPIDLDQLLLLRDRILDGLAGDVPAVDCLAAVHVALAAVAAGQPPESFALSDEPPREAGFDGYLDLCVAAHQPSALARLLHQYRRFGGALPVDEIPAVAALEDADWAALPAALAYDPRWRETLDPRRDDVQSILRRYLAYRFFSPFHRTPAAEQVTFTYGHITHGLATTFRYTIGLARWLGRDIDPPLLILGMGASEHLYRTLRLPTNTMPWFSTPQPSGPPRPSPA